MRTRTYKYSAFGKMRDKKRNGNGGSNYAL